VDANQEIRWERSKIRSSSTDDVTFEEFKEAEERESISENPAEQNLPKCLTLTDHIIYNNGTIEDLEEQVLEYLSTQENQELQKIS
ncbi:MAG: hypothetical protein PHP08_01680, partial [Candidatus Dojkabacteria bacterium]|nr:hypothetical protein [Candidatus Dojkabacteria bacterium]